MADNNFFANFLKKDKLFHATQNNPVHKKALHQLPYASTIRLHFQDNAGHRIVGAYNELVRFYPAPGAPAIDQGQQRVRLQAANRLKTFVPLRQNIQIETKEQFRQYIADEFAQKPPYGAQVLRDPVAPNRNEKTLENQKALASVNHYRFHTYRDRKPSNSDANYWYPDYQGNYHFSTRNSINVPVKFPEHLHKPSNLPTFLPKGYLNNKQKESYVWLKMNWA